MKRILLSTVVMAFAIAAQAGDGQGCCAAKTKVSADKKPACTATTTTKVSADSKCPVMASKEGKAGCCAAKGQATQVKKVLSPKASDLAKN